MEIGLNREEEIKMILKRIILIYDPNIYTLILKWMKCLEKADAYNYHNQLWERIAGSYFKSIEKRYPTYSYVMNASKECKIIAFPDNILDYYLETGQSYQVRDTILIQIKEYNECNTRIYKIWFYQDDKSLSKLTKKIMKQMKKMTIH